MRGVGVQAVMKVVHEVAKSGPKGARAQISTGNLN